MNWTRYTDARVTFDDMDVLLRELAPNLIAGAHGGIVDNVQSILPLFKHGMIMATDGVPPADAPKAMA
jgi:hypothetical protein